MNTQDMMTLTCCQDHILTENIWFGWSETSYSGDESIRIWHIEQGYAPLSLPAAENVLCALNIQPPEGSEGGG